MEFITLVSLLDICNGLSESAYNKITDHINSTFKAIFGRCGKKKPSKKKSWKMKNQF